MDAVRVWSSAGFYRRADGAIAHRWVSGRRWKCSKVTRRHRGDTEFSDATDRGESMRLHRRQWLKALGLGALSNFALRNRVAFADPPISPSRVVFFVQPHGHVPSGWNMAMPGLPTDRFAERAL